LFQLVVIEYKICSIEYFFDKMQFYELNTILSSLNKSIKNTWEQTRMIAYTIAQCNSTKQLKPTDILKFDWDNNDHKQEIITKEDVARLKEKATTFASKLNTK
jgi:hypothetical protein